MGPVKRARSRSCAEAGPVLPRSVCQASCMDFDDALVGLGFAPSTDRAFTARAGRRYEARPNEFMTYTVNAFDDGTAIFSWEFALGDFLAGKGLQLGSDEALNQYVFPREDLRGEQSGAWLVAAMEQTEALLSTIRFDRPD
jgi:hypothetical protein